MTDKQIYIPTPCQKVQVDMTYKTRAGTAPTSNLRPVTAPVVPLLTLATLIRPLFLQAIVSKRALSN